MPCYPALALLLGSAMAAGGAWVRRGTRALAVIAGCAALACALILLAVRNVPAPGDISQALSQHPSAYTLSLGHMEDLTLESFAYLRLPLGMAALAFAIGAIGCWRFGGRKRAGRSLSPTPGPQPPRAPLAAPVLAIAAMMVLFFHAARVAMVAFDPYLSSRPLATALLESPPGRLVVDHHYYTFSSIFFYTGRPAWLLNGRFNNLVYGSYAPGAPDVFLTDAQWKDLWLSPERSYVIAMSAEKPRFEKLAGAGALFTVAQSGGKMLLTNQAISR